MKQSALLVLPLVLVAAGCAERGAAEPGGGVATTGTSDRVENAASFSCADVDGAGFVPSHGEATRLNMRSAGKEFPAMNVILADYDRNGGSYHPGASAAGQHRVILTFAAASGAELAPGSFSIDGAMGGENRLSVGIEALGAHCGLYSGEGSGEILAIDEKTISGRVSVKDERGTWIEATFSLPYEVSPY